MAIGLHNLPSLEGSCNVCLLTWHFSQLWLTSYQFWPLACHFSCQPLDHQTPADQHPLTWLPAVPSLQRFSLYFSYSQSGFTSWDFLHVHSLPSCSSQSEVEACNIGIDFFLGLAGPSGVCLRTVVIIVCTSCSMHSCPLKKQPARPKFIYGSNGNTIVSCFGFSGGVFLCSEWELPYMLSGFALFCCATYTLVNSFNIG